jgi:hypothetical protein
VGEVGHPPANPERVNSRGTEAKEQGIPLPKYQIFNEIKELRKYLLKNSENSGDFDCCKSSMISIIIIAYFRKSL